MMKRFLTNQEQVAKALGEAKDAGHIYIEEIADVVGVSDRHAYRYVEAEVALKAHQFITLALIEHSRGGNRLLSLIMPDGTALVTTSQPAINGSMTDEVVDSVRHTAGAEEAFSKGNYEKVEEHANGLRATADRIQQEATEAKTRGRK